MGGGSLTRALHDQMILRLFDHLHWFKRADYWTLAANVRERRREEGIEVIGRLTRLLHPQLVLVLAGQPQPGKQLH